MDNPWFSTYTVPYMLGMCFLKRPTAGMTPISVFATNDYIAKNKARDTSTD